MSESKPRTILITGGTGSIGSRLVQRLVTNDYLWDKIIIFSRDEHKQYHLAQSLSQLNAKKEVIFRIGDIRDLDRLKECLIGVDTVVHTAALKHVPLAETNPIEYVKTNILGAQNLILACQATDVKKVVALSTDKAVAPTSHYGATKLCADKLFQAQNPSAEKSTTCFSIVRFGNMLGAEGSVLPLFLKKRDQGTLPITHPEMTRFSILPEEAVDVILFALTHAQGNEIFIPRLPAFKVIDLAKAIAPTCLLEIVGLRPGEKIHEVMVSADDAAITLKTDKYFIQFPVHFELSHPAIAYYQSNLNAEIVNAGFEYSTRNADSFLDVTTLNKQIMHLIS